MRHFTKIIWWFGQDEKDSPTRAITGEFEKLQQSTNLFPITSPKLILLFTK